MSLNVSQLNSSASWQNVDSATLSQLTSEILNRKSPSNAIDLNNVDLTKFNREMKGIDFYSKKTPIELQNQISILNYNPEVSSLNLTKLGSIAAVNGYTDVANKINGKMTIQVLEAEPQQIQEVQTPQSMTEVFSTAELARDRRGSNPFSYFKPSDSKEENGLDLTV